MLFIQYLPTVPSDVEKFVQFRAFFRAIFISCSNAVICLIKKIIIKMSLNDDLLVNYEFIGVTPTDDVLNLCKYEFKK